LEDRRLLAILPTSPALLSSIEGFNIDDNAFNTGAAVIQPPDPFGAAGPAHILNVGNTSIQWFTKDGTLEYHTSLKNFFAPLRPDYGIFDPKVLYDQYANRFLVVTLEAYQTGAPFNDLFDMSRIMIAVSDDSDPNGKWYYHSINSMVNVPDPTDPEEVLVTWTDYPGFALDEEAIYITGNLFEFRTQDPYGNRLWIMDKGLAKGGFYDNGSATVTMYDPSALTGVDYSGNYTLAENFRCMQPAHVYGTAPTGVGTWLTLYDGNNNGVEELVDVIRVDNPLTTPEFTRFTINVGDIEDTTIPIDYSSPQRSSTARLDGGDRRVLNAVWRDNSLYATTVINPSSGPDVNQVTTHWFRFDTSNAQTLKLADQGNVGGEEIGFAAHTIWPAVNVDSKGNMVIGFSATGPTIYPGSYYAVRTPSDPAGTVRLAGELAEGLDVFALGGTAANSVNRWGDYTSVALDPTDGVTFWLYNMYALPRQTLPGRWGTRWGSLRVAEAPAIPVPGPTTISGVVWHDQDEDRRRDPTEPGLAGWTVYADLDGDGERDIGEPTAKTDSTGKYSFTVNVTGTLTIREALEPGWRQTFPGGTTQTQVVTITGGGTMADVDFGNSDNDGFDHGDAPWPYPTWEADNGAKHAIVSGFGLGVVAVDGTTVIVDGEPDGLPDANALGDDDDNFDDENGVVFTNGMMPGQTAAVTVTVSLGTNSPGLLQGWIDFNRDGDWADAGEQVFKNRTLGAGVHALSVEVPTTALPGTTYARFRYGHEKDLSYVGTSYSDGEVEDYRVDILSVDPAAVDDQYAVEQDSRDNLFNVLLNDVPGASGIASLRLSRLTQTPAHGTAVIDTNGTGVFTDDFIRYTPQMGYSGPDAFTYEVQDTGNGKTDTAIVSITVTQAQGDAPVAVDDTYTVTTTAPQPLNVLQNDRWGPTGQKPTIISWDASGLVGAVTLVQNVDNSGLQGFNYQSNGFVGSEQFTYTIIDTNGASSTGTVTVQSGSGRIADDLVRFRLEARDLNGNLVTQVGKGTQFQIWGYVRDMRNVPNYQPAPGIEDAEKGVFSAYMDLLYDTARVSYAGLEYSEDYAAGRFADDDVPGILSEVGAFQGTGLNNNLGKPYGATEKLLYKATFMANELGSVQFRTDPADELPLHETALNTPEMTVEYPQIEFLATTLQVIESPELAQVQLKVTDLSGKPLDGQQIAPGTEFYVSAWIDDLGVRNGTGAVSADQEGIFSAYLDITYDPTLARPVTVPTTVNPLGFDIASGPLFKAGLKGIDWWQISGGQIGIVDEVGAYQGSSYVQFSDQRLLFQIRFRALGGSGGQLVFSANPADEVVNETTLINPYPGVSVPTSQIKYVAAPTVIVAAGAGEGEFTNPVNRFDVNNDGFHSAADIVAGINAMNREGITVLSRVLGEGEAPARRMFYDVNGDGIHSPRDILEGISRLNSPPANEEIASGEGEAAAEVLVLASPVAAGPVAELPPADILRLLSASEVREATAPLAQRQIRGQKAELDYFAAAGAETRDGTELSMDSIVSDELADDIAAAWGQRDAIDLLPGVWA